MNTVFESTLARLIGIGKDRPVDMDDHLIALTRSAGIEIMSKRGLGDHPQCVRLLLAHGGRVAFRVVDPGIGIEPVTGCRERLAEHRASLRCQPSADHDHAVVVLEALTGEVSAEVSSPPRLPQ